MSARRFELLKDAPDAKAGTILKQEKDGDLYMYEGVHDDGDESWYTPEVVENNPTWFKEWFGVVSVSDIEFDLDEEWIKFHFKGLHKAEQVASIKKLLETVLIPAPTPEWEIVAEKIGKIENGEIKRMDIHSVKRLSDGEVFTVGDRLHIKSKDCFNIRLDGFEIKAGLMFVRTAIYTVGLSDVTNISRATPTPTTFQWTDELVYEYYNWAEEKWKQNVGVKSDSMMVEEFKKFKLNNSTKGGEGYANGVLNTDEKYGGAGGMSEKEARAFWGDKLYEVGASGKPNEEKNKSSQLPNNRERILVFDVKHTDPKSPHYLFTTSRLIPTNFKAEQIRQAIEAVLNDEKHPMERYYKVQSDGWEKEYKELAQQYEEDLKKAFEAGGCTVIADRIASKYYSFQDYKNTLLHKS